MPWNSGAATSKNCADKRHRACPRLRAARAGVTNRATGRYGLPDMRLGPNLYADTTLQEKLPGNPQIRNWHAIQPGHYFIIRPGAVGGAYALPPASIRPPRARTHKPGI